MKSVGFNAFGGPEQLVLITRPLPEPAPDEVVVRVVAATINPTDISMLRGDQAALMSALRPPFVAGMEFSGYVHATTSQDEFPIGMPVFGIMNPRLPAGGAQSEYVAVSRHSIAALDPDVDVLRAASLPMNGLTALMALEMMGLPAGASILITGATGGFGHIAIQLAHAAGYRIFAGAMPAEAEALQELGVKHVLPRSAKDQHEALLRYLPEGVDALIDGALIGNQLSARVKTGGCTIAMRASHAITDPRLRNFVAGVTKGLKRQDLLRHLASAYAQGTLRPRLAADGVLPAAQAQMAYQRAISGGHRGRILLQFAE